MKTALTITGILITIALFGQDTTKIISRKLYRIQDAYCIKNNRTDTLDATEFYTAENGLILMDHFINHKGVMKIDRGYDQVIYYGEFKENLSLQNSSEDSHTYEWTFREAAVDSTQIAVIKKTYRQGSLEDTMEKEYEFYIRKPRAIEVFIATEITSEK